VLVVVALVVAGIAWAAVSTGSGGHSASSTTATVPLSAAATTSPAATTSSSTPEPTTPTGAIDDHQAGWVAAENRAPGTAAWRISSQNPRTPVEGYASATSTSPGTPLGLYVSTSAPTFTAQVFRMGYYGGAQGRLVWTSPVEPGHLQRAALVDAATHMARAPWSVSLSVPVGPTWLPGAYLVKLSAAGGDQSYVPFTIDDPSAHAHMLILDAVANWQAYNSWGGCSLYECFDHGKRVPGRAVAVSFDRPYARTFLHGSADFLDHELPLIALVESKGYDVNYATSIDLDLHPELARSTNAVLSLGHDEYYSSKMRTALVSARDAGVNLAFFGANAVYRHIRLESDGASPDRVEVNYRNLPDPIRFTDPAEVTTEWRNQRKPEAALVGIQYLCANIKADEVVADAGNWIWAGAGVTDGEVLPKLVGTEADGLSPYSPKNLNLLAASPVKCHGGELGRISYYSAPSGAGVFASGTIWWVCALEANYCSTKSNIHAVTTATLNVLAAFATGPAGKVHPSY